MSNQNNGEQSPQAPVAVTQEKNIAETVMGRIKIFEESGTIHLPKGYSAPNALRVAWLVLQDTKDVNTRPVLEVCTKESIANALLKMIIQGLNPVKHQCSFIAYGPILTCQREYQGAIAIAKREAGLISITANAVFKGDDFAYEIDPVTLVKRVTKHTQTLETMESGEVIGAYAVKTYEGGRVEAEVMSMGQIRNAWKMGQTKGESPAHKNFPDQMAMKTVINRALKTDLNSSDDSAILPEEVDEDMRQLDDRRTAGVKGEIATLANKQEISIPEDDNETAGAVDTATGEVLDTTSTRGF